MTPRKVITAGFFFFSSEKLLSLSLNQVLVNKIVEDLSSIYFPCYTFFIFNIIKNVLV